MTTEKQQKNLIPFDKRTESEQRAISRKGGKASGEARSFAARTNKLLELPVKASFIENMQQIYEFSKS